jgi:hypothetical protein
MTNVDPLIQRELSSMELGIYANRDLTPLIVAKVRRRIIRKIAIACSIVLGLVLTSAITYAIVKSASNSETTSSNMSSTGVTQNNVGASTGISSDYPLTWEPGLGEGGAISKAAGLGDTLGGLTAIGLKVSWSTCANESQCPVTWTLTVQNNTQDLISLTPALGVFTDHSSLTSMTRPTTVTPGQVVPLIFAFPEFKDALEVSSSATWQWNWFLTPNK